MIKNYYKAVIEYDGSGYAGFQWQKGIPTIQHDLNEAIRKIVPGNVTTMGASRTDTGVHAKCQIVKITAQHELPSQTIVSDLNNLLPPQIRCLSLTACSGDFRPEIQALSKEYRYLFTNNKMNLAYGQRFMANFHHPLAMEAMKECLSAIVGTHDFKNFCSTGSNIKTTHREVYSCELDRVNPHSIFDQRNLFTFPQEITSCYQLKIVGKGFLKQMVRHIVSGLWSVGSRRINQEDFSRLLDGPKFEKRLWKVAPANGLFLFKIDYERI